jgi:hypothetical protein
VDVGTDKAVLEIDGVAVPLIAVWVHLQNVPFPGGHRYVLRIPKSQADAWLAGRRQTWDDLRHGLWFQSPFSELAGSARYTGPTTHVLNTMDAVEETEGLVNVCGVCSTFLRANGQ